jgi:hypothetical protein
LDGHGLRALRALRGHGRVEDDLQDGEARLLAIVMQHRDSLAVDVEVAHGSRAEGGQDALSDLGEGLAPAHIGRVLID